MEITEVKVFPIGEEKLKAFVSVVFDRCFMVNDIKIIQGRDGLFISMPSRKKKNGEFKDVAHPLNNETRRRIEGQVLGEYQRVLAERGEELPAPPRVKVAPPAVAGVTDGAGPAANGPRPSEPSDPPSEAVPIAAAAPAASEPVAAEPVAARAGSDGNSSGSGEGERPDQEPTLEEVQELHLRDSFWSVS
jgi:stage V sporulation protein G